jgi:hypothetical protein
MIIPPRSQMSERFHFERGEVWICWITIQSSRHYLSDPWSLYHNLRAICCPGSNQFRVSLLGQRQSPTLKFQKLSISWTKTRNTYPEPVDIRSVGHYVGDITSSFWKNLLADIIGKWQERCRFVINLYTICSSNMYMCIKHMAWPCSELWDDYNDCNLLLIVYLYLNMVTVF